MIERKAGRHRVT